MKVACRRVIDFTGVFQERQQGFPDQFIQGWLFHPSDRTVQVLQIQFIVGTAFLQDFIQLGLGTQQDKLRRGITFSQQNCRVLQVAAAALAESDKFKGSFGIRQFVAHLLPAQGRAFFPGRVHIQLVG